MNSLKPIRYNRRQVALMVTVARHFDSGFAGCIGETSTRVNLVAAGIAAPTAKIAAAFGLRKDGRGYQWNPR